MYSVAVRQDSPLLLHWKADSFPFCDHLLPSDPLILLTILSRGVPSTRLMCLPKQQLHHLQRPPLPALTPIAVALSVRLVQLRDGSSVPGVHLINMLLKLSVTAGHLGHSHRLPNNSSDWHAPRRWYAPGPIHKANGRSEPATGARKKPAPAGPLRSHPGLAGKDAHRRSRRMQQTENLPYRCIEL